MAGTAELSTRSCRQSVVVISEDFVRALAGVGKRGELAADLHQAGGDAAGSGTAALPRQTLPQGQCDCRRQALAGQSRKFGRKLVRFTVLDVQMPRLPHNRNISIFHHRCKTRRKLSPKWKLLLICQWQMSQAE